MHLCSCKLKDCYENQNERACPYLTQYLVYDFCCLNFIRFLAYSVINHINFFFFSFFAFRGQQFAQQMQSTNPNLIENLRQSFGIQRTEADGSTDDNDDDKDDKKDGKP